MFVLVMLRRRLLFMFAPLPLFCTGRVRTARKYGCRCWWAVAATLYWGSFRDVVLVDYKVLASLTGGFVL